jgi:hypothetical protein
MVASMKFIVFWDVVPCSHEVDRRFKGAYCLRHHGEVLVGNPEGKRPLVRPRCRWEDGTRMDLRETGWGSVEWVQLVQDSELWWDLVNTVMNLWVLAPLS